LTIDLDATLIGSHSEKEGAAGNFKGGFGFHPMLAYADQTSEALAGDLRPGNAVANAAADEIAVAEQAIAQIPEAHITSSVICAKAHIRGGRLRLAWLERLSRRPRRCPMANAPVTVVYPINGQSNPIIGPVPGSLNAAYVIAGFSRTCGGGPHSAKWWCNGHTWMVRSSTTSSVRRS